MSIYSMPRRGFFMALREMQASLIGQGSLDVRVDEERFGRVSMWLSAIFYRAGEIIRVTKFWNILATRRERIGVMSPAQIAFRNTADMKAKPAQEQSNFRNALKRL